jgi:4-hydroxybenzoate polyprenyltransferase
MYKTGRQNIVQGFYSIFSTEFWHAYLITMRPYLLFVSGSAALVGLAYIEKDLGWIAMVAFIPLFLSYGFGQALTDCFQTDTDSISSPYRPLVQGIISKKQVLGVSLSGLLISVIILGYLNPVILIFGMFSVLGLLTYTFFKKYWWGGPPWNAWIVALLPIIGRYVDRGFQLSDLTIPRELPFLLSIFAIFFAYSNFVVMGYFKDITADRETGYQTFPVVFGWKPAAIYSDLTGFMAFLFTGGALYTIGDISVWSVALFATASATSLYAQIGIHKTRNEQKTHRFIENCVRSFILYCLAIVIACKPEWLFWVIIFYMLFELVLYLRPEKSQV